MSSAQDSYIYDSFDSMAEEHSINQATLKQAIQDVQTIYLNDGRPWVLGYSGGKDSTAIAELVYAALKGLPSEKRTKPVFIVSSNTLVEQPVVVNLLKETLLHIELSAKEQDLPITCHEVLPEVDQTFWVNLLGRGYPAPSNSFRWCTERMKIDPVSEFIKSRVSEFGEVVVILGSRIQESASRAQVIKKHREESTYLARHTTLPSAFIYTPIADWSADEVWEFLLSSKTPWGKSNRPLFDLYKGSNDGECPVVIDATTPSCGNSRFGCWTCTVVTKDRAMEGLIKSGETWMQPLLDFRNLLAETQIPEKKSEYRNSRRRNGRISLMRKREDEQQNGEVTEDKHIPGPYKMKYRRSWLKKLLAIEKQLRAHEPEIELITRPELHEIRKQWAADPLEPAWADPLPLIFKSVYPEDESVVFVRNDSDVFDEIDEAILQDLSLEIGIEKELLMKLIETERQIDGLSKRRHIFRKLDSVLSEDWGEFQSLETKSLKQKEYALFDEKIETLEAELLHYQKSMLGEEISEDKNH
jgi:DNA sulfur modification protein DndC